MALLGAEAAVGGFGCGFVFGGRDVFAAGAVTDFALHGAEVFDVSHGGAAGLAVTGDVAADAVQIEFFVLTRERGVGSRVRGLVPEFALRGVTLRTRLDADVRRLP